MTNAEKFEQTFGVGQANLAIADASWWDKEYIVPIPDIPEFHPVKTSLYDQEEIHKDCSVQILRNSVTGEVSIGWQENNERRKLEHAVETIRDYCEGILCNECQFGCDSEDDPYHPFECYLKMWDPCDWILEEEE